MGLNTTEAERREQAAQDFALKMQLEIAAAVAFRSLFNTISRDLELFYQQTGNVPSAEVYSDETAAIVGRQNRRVSQAFMGQLLDFLKANPDDSNVLALQQVAQAQGQTIEQVIAAMEFEIATNTQEFIRMNTAQDTKFITQTTQKELDSAIVIATTLLLEEGKEPTRAAVSKLAAKDFKNRGVGRANTLATTVTQKAAEGTKQIERDAFFNKRNSLDSMAQGVLQVSEVEIWISVGDERVRLSHVEADGQIKEGVFTVQGQSLNFPGDTSLGATVDNTINCRCAAIPVINDVPITPEFQNG